MFVFGNLLHVFDIFGMPHYLLYLVLRYFLQKITNFPPTNRLLYVSTVYEGDAQLFVDLLNISHNTTAEKDGGIFRQMYRMCYLTVCLGTVKCKLRLKFPRIQGVYVPHTA